MMPDGTSTPAIVASNYREINKKSLIGICDITITKMHIVIRGCMWHKTTRADGSVAEWVAFPSKEYQVNGERKFSPLIEFTDRAASDRFRAAALDAVKFIAAQG